MEFYENELYVAELNRLSKNKYMQECLAGTTVVITGARGLIGSEFIDAVMYANINIGLQCKIYAIVRREPEARERFAQYLESEYFQLIRADINIDDIEINEDIDYFIHAASNTHPMYYATKPIETILTNTVGTNNTLKFAVAHRCKCYVYMSSVEVYGENRGDVDKFTEDYCGYIDSNTLRAGYPEGKRVGEALCQAYRKEHHMTCVIPRVARCYGPGLLEEDSKALSQFIKKAAAGEDIVLKSAGKQFFSYVYVADVVDAIITLLAKGKDGETYNIVGRDSDVTLGDLAEMLACQAGKKVVYEIPEQEETEGYSRATKAVLCGDKMRTIGWEAVYSLGKGLQHTLWILERRKNGKQK